MPGFHAVEWLAKTGRVRYVKVKVATNDRRAVNKMLPRNSKDRHYLRLLICTVERIFASHDFDDFTEAVRLACKKRWDTVIVEVDDLLHLVGATS